MKDDENEFPLFLDIADRQLAHTRLARRPDLLQPVLAVFDDPDPNEKFPEWARCYIGKAGHDVREAAIKILNGTSGSLIGRRSSNCCGRR